MIYRSTKYQVSTNDKELSSTTLLLLCLRYADQIVSLANTISIRNKWGALVMSISRVHAKLHTYSGLFNYRLSAQQRGDESGTQKDKGEEKGKVTGALPGSQQKSVCEYKVKYYVLLPDEEAHHAFPQTHGAASYAQRVHPKLIEKIYELVFEGVTSVQEVKRALKHHVTCSVSRLQT